MKSKWNLAAFVMAMLTVVAHVFGGGAEIWLPVYESNLSEVVRITMGLVWHGLTILFIIMAGLSVVAYRWSKLAFGINICLTSINMGFSGLALIYGFAASGSVLLLPQWILFLPMMVFTFMALKAAQKMEA